MLAPVASWIPRLLPADLKKKAVLPEGRTAFSKSAVGLLFFLHHPRGDNNDGGNNKYDCDGCVHHDGVDFYTGFLQLSSANIGKIKNLAIKSSLLQKL
jgi:hypothetical protein